MVTFIGKTTSDQCYLHIQLSENDVDEEETKLPICNSITSLYKSDCVRGPSSLPSSPNENLKIGQTFLLSSHLKQKRIPPLSNYYCPSTNHGLGEVTNYYSGCIGLGTFSVASYMTLGVGYCLPTTIFVSIYKGLNEIFHSSHPGRGGGHFSAHFLDAWLTKNFDTYKLDGEASSSPCMVKFNGLG
ncbi:hypothetical protein Cgig2_000900 [Carnegiea gigantea]|uniref:Uncharacterized protein n=1 Tax=Carnegiea gigantea TaxID=171969 RepID=A0A9Q1GNR8_9CARY|nr:hypothetical protein Cgig2_000900 [Carnegiea gigantea]